MKKVIISFALWISLAGSAGLLQAQVTIGQNIPPSKFSLLDLNTSVEKKALHLPRLTVAERDALVSATSSAGDKTLARGLKIFNTDINCVEWWNGAKWISNCYTIEEVKCLSGGLDCPPCGMPTTVSPQEFPSGTTVSMLTASGTADAVFFWYYSPTATSPLDPSTPLEDGHTYYVTQMLNKPGGCSESPLVGAPAALVNLYTATCTGNLVFKEDFDSYDNGLDPLSPQWSTQPLAPGMTTYNFRTAAFTNEGAYGLPKDAATNSYAYMAMFTDDHTYPNDRTVGRFVFANGSSTVTKLYEQSVPQICEGANLVFSLWAKGNGKTYLRWRIYRGSDNQQIAEYTTPEIKTTSWRYYEFPFQVPVGESSVWFDVYNTSTATGDNDFGIDDIEVKFCSPPITIAGPTDKTVSKGEMLSLTGYISDASSLGSVPTLTSRWEYSTTGTSGWQEIPNSAIASTVSGSYISNTLTKYYVMPADTGYYRMVAGTPQNINSENCKAKSPTIKITIR